MKMIRINYISTTVCIKTIQKKAAQKVKKIMESDYGRGIMRGLTIKNNNNNNSNN